MQRRITDQGYRGPSSGAFIACAAFSAVLFGGAPAIAVPPADVQLNAQLSQVLADAGFTGTVEASLETRLGRSLDPNKVELGRLLFFDNILGLHSDNSCAGCHSPAFGFGDSQRMAIGV